MHKCTEGIFRALNFSLYSFNNATNNVIGNCIENIFIQKCENLKISNVSKCGIFPYC